MKMKTPRTRCLTLVTLCMVLSVTPPPTLRAQSDDFNDGNDVGWTHYAPLVPYGVPATYSFPNGAYRIQSAASPDIGALGTARVGSVRTDVSYSDFYVSIDVLGWGRGTEPRMGLLARGSDLGLGTTDGYFLYFGVGGQLELARVRNENLFFLDNTPFLVGPDFDYRLVFAGYGSTLRGEVFDLANPSVSLATVSATDTLYTSGNSGLLAWSFGGVGAGPVDVTFDNYFATVPEPSTVAVGVLGMLGLILFRGEKHRRGLRLMPLPGGSERCSPCHKELQNEP